MPAQGEALREHTKRVAGSHIGARKVLAPNPNQAGIAHQLMAHRYPQSSDVSAQVRSGSTAPLT